MWGILILVGWLVQVRLGDHDISAPGVAERVVAVAGVHVHELYRSPSYEHDIAVLELAEEVDLNIYTPACMAQVWTHFYGNVIYIYIILTSEYGHRGILREDRASVRLGQH